MKTKTLILTCLVYLFASMSTSAQTIVKGDMNGDGQVTVADVTSVVNTAVGKTPMETINVGTSGNPYMVDNSQVVGTWYASDGTHFSLNADGTTDFPGGATYEFMPIHGDLLIYDATGIPIRDLPLVKVTTEYLLAVNHGTGIFTYYTNSSFIVSEITLSSSLLTLTPHSTAQLTATVTPSDALNSHIVWSSSNANVATVDSNGFVTAVAGGTCTVTAMAQDGSGVTATCEVMVSQRVTGITLNHTSLTMAPDEAQRLTATVLPADATNTTVTWTSSNENVATVSSSGWVFAVGTGTCTITCTAQDGSGVTAACQITVVRLVNQITLSSSSLTLGKGVNQTLTATVVPSNATNTNIAWTTSNSNVATVNSDGQVTGINVGTCTITCTAQDGSGVTATCAVSVTQLVTGITLNQSALTMDVSATQQLDATIAPSNASTAVIWSSSNTSVATVDANGLVTAVAVGICTITCSATDGSGISTTCAVTVDYGYVDLGLPSGTLWATCNIGATSPEEYGDYFAWGETSGYNDGKTTFSWSNYTYCNGSSSTLTKYCNRSSYGYNGFTDTLKELELTDDAAYMNWGSDWCMPSMEQFEELINSSYTTTTWTTQNGKYGRKITSKTNGNSIFLPAAGDRDGTSLFRAGSYGYYWSRTLSTDYPYYAWYLNFDGDDVDTYYYGSRYLGLSVRPVRLSQ